MTTESSWEYFNQAISLSAPVGVPLFVANPEAKEVYGNATQQLKCLDDQGNQNVSCLRGKSAEEIFNATHRNQTHALNVAMAERRLTMVIEPYGPVLGLDEKYLIILIIFILITFAR